MIVIGLGSGRSGSQSLARLLNLQDGALVTHEKNPHDMAWHGAEEAVLENLREFEHVLDSGVPRLRVTHRRANRDVLERSGTEGPVTLVGDVAFYYLPYVTLIAERSARARFVCLKRDRDATVRSYVRKTRRRPSSALLETLGVRRVVDRNHWVEHDGGRWDKDPLWDRCYPKYDASSKEEAIGLYWQEYYDTAARLERLLPGRFRVFPVDALNSREGQDAIIAHAGIPGPERVFDVGLRHNPGPRGER